MNLVFGSSITSFLLDKVDVMMVVVVIAIAIAKIESATMTSNTTLCLIKKKLV